MSILAQMCKSGQSVLLEVYTSDITYSEYVRSNTLPVYRHSFSSSSKSRLYFVRDPQNIILITKITYSLNNTYFYASSNMLYVRQTEKLTWLLSITWLQEFFMEHVIATKKLICLKSLQ